jgi:hypothetical protein
MATPVQSPIYQRKSQATSATEFQSLPTEPGGPIFKSYGDYLVATQKDVRPGSSYNATSTTPTGFLEFKPRDMATQRKYDAMSPDWEGVDSSMKAVEQGVYSLDAAEANRQDLREKVGVPEGTTGPTTVYLNQNTGDLWASFKDLLPKGDTGIPEAKEEQALWPPIGICATQ